MQAQRMETTVYWSSRELAQAVAGLPAGGAALPSRVVLLPRARMAHSLRRELLRLERHDALIGTRFVTHSVAAGEVLAAHGLSFTRGEEARRPLRLRALFRATGGQHADRANAPPQGYFPPELLRDAPGWDRAFARTIGDLEAAGLRPADLESPSGAARLRDLLWAWRWVDADAGSSWTESRILLEAARLLRAGAGAPFAEGVLAAIDGSSLSAADALFLTSLPAIRLTLLGARPLRQRHLGRIRRLLGEATAALLVRQEAPRAHGTERAILASYLFEPAEVLADPGRVRSSGMDGTVQLEEHASLDEELEATADWVAARVLEHATPLEEIAVLVPSRDPYVELVSARVARLPFRDGHGVPVFAPEGLPAAASAEGARFVAVVRALRRHLEPSSLASLLPTLRAADEKLRLTTARAGRLAYGLGTVGGSPADPRGALGWASRAREREREVSDELAVAARPRDRTELERFLDDLRALRPAIEALCETARLVVEDAPLASIWSALHDFATKWLVVPLPSVGLLARLDEDLSAASSTGSIAQISGEDALRAIEETIERHRLVRGRYGDPAVYVGTIAGAAGLPFSAVRILGLAEGALPSAPREDPVLPDTSRRLIGDFIPRSEDVALRELQQLDGIVRDTGEQLAISMSRLDLRRANREPSSIFVEIAAALGRPGKGAEVPVEVIPGMRALQRDYFAPARQSAHELRRRAPLTASAVEDLLAEGGGPAPALLTTGSYDLERVESLLSDERPGPLDGVIGTAAFGVAPTPGLSPDEPLSALRLRTLLECPHRFLLEDVLRLRAPYRPPASGEIERLPYGNLLHRIWEGFAREHGRSFGERERTLLDWQDIGDVLVEAHFEGFVRGYPLAGRHLHVQQREKAKRDFRRLLETDWSSGRRRDLVAMEHEFGSDTPVRLQVEEGPLYVRGYIDRLDLDEGRVLVRDLKTGKSRPRIANDRDPDHLKDLQLGIYALVARHVAAEMGLPDRIAAAYCYLDHDHASREFVADCEDLERHTIAWLGIAAKLLRAGIFPRTPRETDCSFCPHQPVCGPGATQRAAEMTAAVGEGAVALARLKALPPRRAPKSAKKSSG